MLHIRPSSTPTPRFVRDFRSEWQQRIPVGAPQTSGIRRKPNLLGSSLNVHQRVVEIWREFDRLRLIGYRIRLRFTRLRANSGQDSIRGPSDGGDSITAMS